jgi:hypothetical protein
VKRYTLDTNCVFALEDERPEATNIRRLLARSLSGEATVQIAAIAAAERNKSGRPIDNFSEFQMRLGRLSLGSAKVLLPPMYVGIAFADHCLLHGDETLAAEKRIHDVLFSSVPFEFDGARYSTASSEWRRWLNAKCDVLTMWCHLHHGGDVFVSSDKNFHALSKKPRLLAMGAGQIIRPSEL